jgi:phage terminase large subunit-like protein
MVLQGRLRVHVNPALRSAVAGAKFLTSPAGLRRFDKGGATQRIDMLIALVQAVGAWYMEAPEGTGETVYEILARQRAAAVTEASAGAKVAQPVRHYDEDEDL